MSGCFTTYVTKYVDEPYIAWNWMRWATFLSQAVISVLSCASWQSREIADKYALRGFKVIQGHRIWHQLNGHTRLPTSD